MGFRDFLCGLLGVRLLNCARLRHSYFGYHTMPSLKQLKQAGQRVGERWRQSRFIDPGHYHREKQAQRTLFSLGTTQAIQEPESNKAGTATASKNYVLRGVAKQPNAN